MMKKCNTNQMQRCPPKQEGPMPIHAYDPFALDALNQGDPLYVHDTFNFNPNRPCSNDMIYVDYNPQDFAIEVNALMPRDMCPPVIASNMPPKVLPLPMSSQSSIMTPPVASRSPLGSQTAGRTPMMYRSGTVGQTAMRPF
jgi:hypothetical protein